MTIVIPVDPATKKNSQRIVTIGGRPRILPSKRFADYQKQAGQYLMPVKPETPVDEPVEITCLFFRATRRRCDLTNLLEAADDVLVHYGIIADDNANVIVSHDGSRVLYDRENPRTEITITPMRDLPCQR